MLELSCSICAFSSSLEFCNETLSYCWLLFVEVKSLMVLLCSLILFSMPLIFSSSSDLSASNFSSYSAFDLWDSERSDYWLARVCSKSEIRSCELRRLSWSWLLAAESASSLASRLLFWLWSSSISWVASRTLSCVLLFCSSCYCCIFSCPFWRSSSCCRWSDICYWFCWWSCSICACVEIFSCFPSCISFWSFSSFSRNSDSSSVFFLVASWS